MVVIVVVVVVQQWLIYCSGNGSGSDRCSGNGTVVVYIP